MDQQDIKELLEAVLTKTDKGGPTPWTTAPTTTTPTTKINDKNKTRKTCAGAQTEQRSRTRTRPDNVHRSANGTENKNMNKTRTRTTCAGAQTEQRTRTRTRPGQRNRIGHSRMKTQTKQGQTGSNTAGVQEYTFGSEKLR